MSLPETFSVEVFSSAEDDALVSVLQSAGIWYARQKYSLGMYASSHRKFFVDVLNKRFFRPGEWSLSPIVRDVPLATVLAELSPKKATFVVRDISLGGKWNQLQSALLLAGYTNVDAMPWFLETSWIAIVNSATKRFAMGPEEHLEWHKQRPSAFPVKTFEEAMDLIRGPKVVVGQAVLLGSGAIVDQHADGKFHVPEPWLSIINERDKELAQLRAANEALVHNLDEIDDRNLSLLAKLSAKKSIDFYPEPSPYIRQLAAAELTRQISEAMRKACNDDYDALGDILRAIVLAPVEHDLLGKPKELFGIPIEVEAHTAGVSGWHLVHKVKPMSVVEDDTSNDPVLLAMIRKDRIEKLENELHDLQDAYSELESERNELNRFKQRADREATEYSPTPAPQPEYRQPTKCDGLAVMDLEATNLRILVDDADREWQLKCKMFDIINGLAPGVERKMWDHIAAYLNNPDRGQKRPFRWCKAKVNGTEYDLCQMPNGVFVEDGSVLYPMWGSHDLTDVRFIDGETL